MLADEYRWKILGKQLRSIPSSPQKFLQPAAGSCCICEQFLQPQSSGLYFGATVQPWQMDAFQHLFACSWAVGSLCHLCPWSPVMLCCHYLYPETVWGASLLLWLLPLRQVRFWVLYTLWWSCRWSFFLCCVHCVAWRVPAFWFLHLQNSNSVVSGKKSCETDCFC